MRHNCDHCNKEVQRKVFCSTVCSRVFYNRVRHNGLNVIHNVSERPPVIHNVLNPETTSFQKEHTRAAHKTLNEERACTLCVKE